MTGALPLGSAAFNTKRGGNAGEREDSKLAAIGLELSSTDALAADLQGSFRASDYGYAQFAALEEPLLRAFASSRMQAAIAGVGRNLLEARLHEHHVHAGVGPNGLPWPGPETSITEDIARDEIELHVVGFFRSVASALDCAAAVLIGTARVPRSLARADLLDVLNLDPDWCSKQLPARPAHQLELWVELRELVRDANRDPPENWLEWTLQMRNALLHRGRGLTKLSNRPGRIAQPIYVETERDPHELLRFDPHLSKRPWLTDLQNLVIYGEPFDHWLSETAPETITGVREASVRLCEAASAWALTHWRKKQTQDNELAVSARAWRERHVELDFAGFRPVATRRADRAVVAPDQLELFRLAQRLIDEGHSGGPPP